MPLNSQYLRRLVLEPEVSVLTDRDVMLYALSIGLGRDPLDEYDLHYVYEKSLKVFPTMPLVLGHTARWTSDPRTGITRAMVVHGAQRLETHAELPIGQPLRSADKIRDILDKGPKGAVVVVEREISDERSGVLIARSEAHLFCRADGGFGGPAGPTYEFVCVPDRAPERSIDVPIPANAALLYRLNQDRNPLHAEPAFARKAGFARPILHGLCTFAVAAVAIAKAFPTRLLRSIEARFSRPLLPGETITVDLWLEEETVAFRARVVDRDDVIVLDRGRAKLV